MLARFDRGLVVANFVMLTCHSLSSCIIWSKRMFLKGTICWIFPNIDTFYRISTSCICRTTRIDIVVRYFRLFEKKLHTTFLRRVKLESHLVYTRKRKKPCTSLARRPWQIPLPIILFNKDASYIKQTRPHSDWLVSKRKIRPIWTC